MTLLICKVCNRNNLKVVISFERYPKSISYLFDSSKEAKSDFAPINFIQCLNCNHIQIGSDLPQSFYHDYIMTVSHSNKMIKFQREQAEYFISRVKLQGKKILEVGCGDGNFSLILRSLNCRVFCNEPSKRFRELAEANGLEVDDMFMDNEYSNIHAPFDAIVSREVLEHVPNPIEFLVSIRKQLKHNGSVLIEVPNFEKTLNQLRYYDMFPDHLSYFTKESLTAALLNSGYKNIEINYGMDDEFIYAIAENNYLDVSLIGKAYYDINFSFENVFQNYRNIVVWGAGGKGISALGSLKDHANIKYVVDSDPYKQGKYLPSSGLLVQSPDIFFSDDDIDLLIITNLAYTDEILQILKKNHFQKKVLSLSKTGLADIIMS